MPPHLYWGLVQLAERQILTLEVKGSNPLPPAKRASWTETKSESPKNHKGRLLKQPSSKERRDARDGSLA